MTYISKWTPENLTHCFRCCTSANFVNMESFHVSGNVYCVIVKDSEWN